MQQIVAAVEDLKFDLEIAIEQQIGSQPLPFPGMDKSCSAVCRFFKFNCVKGQMCPFRHVRGDKEVVCKHWLRGLCKKGDDCEFLHQFDMTKMPECYFFTKFGMCSNKECPFLHIDPASKMKDCPWYDRGFCKHGPDCKNRHVRRVLCQNFLNGFCLDGPNCKFVHPSWEIPMMTETQKENMLRITCHNCGEKGHKAQSCPTKNVGNFDDDNTGGGHTNYQAGRMGMGKRTSNLDHIICFKCNGRGHFANRCPTNEVNFS
ncbi:cleavage and polyadenylation specificity factor subunit 4-like [Antedon mediterranea]|uniref:cleavage and polyadenylation specificity factor subunit 4-like n=1 Tax=Antedon mediterranea TaxID=105859 RepID=UPI003AF418C3